MFSALERPNLSGFLLCFQCGLLFGLCVVFQMPLSIPCVSFPLNCRFSMASTSLVTSGLCHCCLVLIKPILQDLRKWNGRLFLWRIVYCHPKTNYRVFLWPWPSVTVTKNCCSFVIQGEVCSTHWLNDEKVEQVWTCLIFRLASTTRWWWCCGRDATLWQSVTKIQFGQRRIFRALGISRGRKLIISWPQVRKRESPFYWSGYTTHCVRAHLEC